MTVNARHRRPRAPKYAKLALGAAAAGTMVLVPSVANADPQPSISQVNDQLNKLYQQAAQADEAYNAAQDAESKLQQQVDGINRQITAEQETMTQTKTRLGGLAAEQYRNGGIDPQLQLMMQANPSTMLNMSATVDRVQANNAETLSLLARQKADLAVKAKEAADKMQLLDAQTKAAEATKKQYDGDVSKAQALLNSLQAQAARRAPGRAGPAAGRVLGGGPGGFAALDVFVLVLVGVDHVDRHDEGVDPLGVRACRRGGGVRGGADREAVHLRGDRPGRVRLLGADPGGLEGGRGVDPADGHGADAGPDGDSGVLGAAR